MLRDEQVGNESDGTSDASAGGTSSASHREIDRALRRIAKARCGLDAEEARWLRRAEAQKNLPAAEEAFKLASAIAIKQIGYKDVRDRRTRLQTLLKDLRGA